MTVSCLDTVLLFTDLKYVLRQGCRHTRLSGQSLYSNVTDAYFRLTTNIEILDNGATPSQNLCCLRAAPRRHKVESFSVAIQTVSKRTMLQRGSLIGPLQSYELMQRIMISEHDSSLLRSLSIIARNAWRH